MCVPHLLLSDHPLCRGLLLPPPEAKHLVHLELFGNLMGNKQHGDLAFQRVYGGGKTLRGLLIQIGDRLVEDEDAWPFQKRSRDGDALPLPAGERKT